MMCEVVSKEFKLVGMKHKGMYKDYAELVPKAAKQFLQKAAEIPNSTGIEVTVYEPQRDQTHLEGTFYVGILVSEKPAFVPEGMEYFDIQHSYGVIRGKETEMGKLYSELDKWILEQRYNRGTHEQYIIEVYYPVKDGVEEVEIHIPIKNLVEAINL